jgi:hypothetical protein
MENKMEFPDIVKVVHSIDSSDINVVGVHLGYDWNLVCDAISSSGFYAEDGDCAFNVYREKTYSTNEIINNIMAAIFDNYPDVDCIQIVNQ